MDFGTRFRPVFITLSDWLGLIFAAAAAIVIFVMTFSTRARQQQFGFALAPFWKDLTKALAASLGLFAYVVIMNIYRGVQTPVLLLAIVVVVMSYLANSTRFGRYSYAIGGNPEATRLSGVNIKKNLFLIFVLMGALCAVAGIVLTGGLRPSESVLKALQTLPIPVLLAKADSYQVASKVHNLTVKTRPTDAKKIALIRDIVARHVNVKKIVEAI